MTQRPTSRNAKGLREPYQGKLNFKVNAQCGERERSAKTYILCYSEYFTGACVAINIHANTIPMIIEMAALNRVVGKIGIK